MTDPHDRNDPENDPQPAGTARRQLAFERTFDASIDDVWELWTTKEGVESWWGPEGFHVEVRAIDPRPGGQMRYAMIASAPEVVAHMKRAGMPLVTEATLTYRQILPRRRLAYSTPSTSCRAWRPTTWRRWSSSTPARRACAWW
jgi:uncharacterized protein YndB with AHSA1/START domain